MTFTPAPSGSRDQVVLKLRSRQVFPYLIVLAVLAAYVILRSAELQSEWIRERSTTSSATDGGRNFSGNLPPQFCLRDVASWWQDGLATPTTSNLSNVYTRKNSDMSWRLSTVGLQGALVLLGCPWLLFKGWRQARSPRSRPFSMNGSRMIRRFVSRVVKGVVPV